MNYELLKRLPWQWHVPLLLLPGILFAGEWSLRPSSITHHPSSLILYPLASANILHWLFNTIAWMQLWQWATPWRSAVAYACAVLIGCASQLPYPARQYWFPEQSVCGFSVVIFFFIGVVFPYMSRLGKAQLLATMAITFFIPGIAASFHLAALICGLIYHTTARTINS